jgi:hypothetical protein
MAQDYSQELDSKAQDLKVLVAQDYSQELDSKAQNLKVLVAVEVLVEEQCQPRQHSLGKSSLKHKPILFLH